MKNIDVTPELINRTCGGWLAVTPSDAPLRLGVTAQTESEAREKFACAVNRWMEILAGEHEAR